MQKKRTNEEWLSDLRAAGPVHTEAITDLRAILVSGLKRGLLSRVNTSAPEFHTQAEDFAQEAVLRILDKLDTFAGRSRFTTWAHKVAVSIALSELRRKRWQDASLDAMTETEDGNVFIPSFMADPGPAPEIITARNDMLQQVNRVIDEGLTEKQRTVLIASIIKGQSTNEVAAMMDMKPNAVYKLLHDARVRLKKRLEEHGLTPAEVLAVFE